MEELGLPYNFADEILELEMQLEEAYESETIQQLN